MSLFSDIKEWILGNNKPRHSDQNLPRIIEEDETIKQTNPFTDISQSSFSESLFDTGSEIEGGAQRLPSPIISRKVVNRKSEPLKQLSPIKWQLTIWECAEKGLCNEAEELLQGGISPDEESVNNYTALHISANEGHQQMCELLLRYGANPNCINYMQKTPLHLACIQGFTKIAQLLVENNASIDFQDIDSNTPLHYAAEYGHIETIRLLLEYKPDISVRNRLGKLPSELSVSNEIQLLFRVPTPRNSMDTCEITTVEIGVTPEDYNVIQLLGRGSFGEVFLVQNRVTQELFAMKTLLKNKVMKNNLVKYAMTERNVLSYIRHPFIVSLNYAFQTPEKLCLILDFCPGGDMSSHLNREKKFSEEKARLYASEILCALEALHKRDIIFRDLKPENVVIDSEGHALLTDFGLSKEGVVGDSTTRSFCGSLAYLAPEMLKRQGHGKTVDWYLLGVLIYEMLVGIPPYMANNKTQLFWNIQYAPLKFPYELSVDSKDLLKKLLNRNPSQRLGYNRDAQEIKEHDFFRDIDWRSVMRRELRLPIPPRFQPPNTIIPPETVFGNLDSASNVKFNNWTFISD